MIKEMGKELIDWFKRKDRCYVSTLAYIFCGILSFFAVASLISPFSINVSFIDDITWKTNLTYLEDLCWKELYFKLYCILVVNYVFYEGVF